MIRCSVLSTIFILTICLGLFCAPGVARAADEADHGAEAEEKEKKKPEEPPPSPSPRHGGEKTENQDSHDEKAKELLSLMESDPQKAEAQADKWLEELAPDEDTMASLAVGAPVPGLQDKKVRELLQKRARDRFGLSALAEGAGLSSERAPASVATTQPLVAQSGGAETKLVSPAANANSEFQKFNQKADELFGKIKTLPAEERKKAFSELAKIYAGLHAIQRETPGRDEVLFPGLLGKMTQEIRSRFRGPYDREQSDRHGGSSVEREWEAALSKEISNRRASADADSILDESLKNAPLAGRALPNLRGAQTISPSWRFAEYSLGALGVLSALSRKLDRDTSLSDEEAKLAGDVLAKWAGHDFVKLRTKEGEPNTSSRLTFLDNQIAKYGKAYSIEVMKILERNQRLRDLLPQGLDLAATKGAMEKSLYNNLKAAAKNPNSESGVGGSNVHTALAFYGISVLPKAMQKDLMNAYEKALSQSNPEGGLAAYAPHRRMPVNGTERDSAARVVPLALARYQAEPSSNNRAALLDALENFSIYSGSLRAEVPRAGVHSGEDQLAPYYFHPALHSAATAIQRLRDDTAKASPEVKAKFAAVEKDITNVALSTWNGKNFLSPGEQTFQGVGPVYSHGLTVASLAMLAKAESSPPLGRRDAPSEPAPSSDSPSGARAIVVSRQSGWESITKDKPLDEIEKLLSHSTFNSDRDARFAEAISNPERREVESAAVDKLLAMRRGNDPKSAQIAKQAMETLRDRPDFKPWIERAKALKPFQPSDDALREVALRRELAKSAPSKLLERLAHEHWSLSAEARDESKESLSSATGDDPLLTAARQIVEGTSEDAKKTLAAARLRATQWNEELDRIFDTSGAVKKEGRSWIEAQVKLYGEDKLLRWAATVGGETGEKTLKAIQALQSDFKSESRIIAKRASPLAGGSEDPIKHGDEIEVRSAGELRKLLTFSKDDGDFSFHIRTQALVAAPRALRVGDKGLVPAAPPSRPAPPPPFGGGGDCSDGQCVGGGASTPAKPEKAPAAIKNPPELSRTAQMKEVADAVKEGEYAIYLVTADDCRPCRELKGLLISAGLKGLVGDGTKDHSFYFQRNIQGGAGVGVFQHNEKTYRIGVNAEAIGFGVSSFPTVRVYRRERGDLKHIPFSYVNPVELLKLLK